MSQRIGIVAVLSIGSVLLWALDVARPWVIQPLPLHVARAVFALLPVPFGVAFVLRRPGKASWGLFAFTLFGAGAPSIASALALPAASLSGAAVFALSLMTDAMPPWRRTAEVLAYVCGGGAVIAGAWAMYSAYSGGFWPQWSVPAVLSIEIGTALATPLILLDTYQRASAQQREHLRWVLAAFAFNAIALPFIALASQSTILIVPNLLIAAITALDAVVVAIGISYGLLKESVWDANVVLTAVLAYGVFAALALAVCAFARLPLVNAALAFGFGAFFALAYPHVKTWCERLIFHRRHEALKHLQVVVEAMPFVDSRDKVDRLIIEEPVHVLELCGGTLLCSRHDGSLVSRHEFGAVPPDYAAQSHEHALAAYLQNEKRALRLDRHGWSAKTLAVPVFSHGVVVAAALYGVHKSGTDLDAREIEMLERLANAAGQAYNRIEIASLRDEVRNLQEDAAEPAPARIKA